MKLLKMSAVLAASLVTVAAHAVTKDIEVSAVIDPALELVTINNRPLPSNMRMEFSFANGLLPASIPMAVRSNDTTTDIRMTVAEDVNLVATNNTTAKPIALEVTYADKSVGTTPTVFPAKELFGEDGNATGFAKLVIKAKGVTKDAAAGEYIGTVRLVVTQEVGTF